MMSLYYDSKQKLNNIFRTIEVISSGEFPYKSGLNSLDGLRYVFENLRDNLDQAKNLDDHDTLKAYAKQINVKILSILPILGIILRSTNIRNAFEITHPLQELADSIIENSPQLIMSSEWDYIPFVYPQVIEDLPNFILIGMPASEAASGLLVPLAGHELGHAVWRNREIKRTIEKKVQSLCSKYFEENKKKFEVVFPEYNPKDLVNRYLYSDSIGDSTRFAALQAEELFCDMFAYGLFGKSYLMAFTYILSPGLVNFCSPYYPSNTTRISVLNKIAKSENIDVECVDKLAFEDQSETNNLQLNFKIAAAEYSIKNIGNDLWESVKQIILEKNILRPDEREMEIHKKQFLLEIPASNPKSLGDIIWAGWEMYLHFQKLAKTEDFNIDKKMDLLNELILKSIEVLEYKRCLEK